MTKHVKGCIPSECDCEIKEECIKIAKKYLRNIEEVIARMQYALIQGDDFTQRVSYIESKVLTEFILYELVDRTKAAIKKLNSEMKDSNNERRQTVNYH